MATHLNLQGKAVGKATNENRNIVGCHSCCFKCLVHMLLYCYGPNEYGCVTISLTCEPGTWPAPGPTGPHGAAKTHESSCAMCRTHQLKRGPSGPPKGPRAPGSSLKKGECTTGGPEARALWVPQGLSGPWTKPESGCTTACTFIFGTLVHLAKCLGET